MSPATFSFPNGLLVPIPTLPPRVIRSASPAPTPVLTRTGSSVLRPTTSSFAPSALPTGTPTPTCPSVALLKYTSPACFVHPPAAALLAETFRRLSQGVVRAARER